MNTHPRGEQISAYVDGMLDLHGMRKVAAHLRECHSCRTIFEDLQETKAVLLQAPAPAAPPAEFWVNAYRTIRVQERENQLQEPPFLERWGRAWGVSQKRRASGLAVAAALCIALFTQISNSPVSPPPSVKSAVSSEPADFVDFTSLVHAHTQSVAIQPLADPDRQAMISAEVDKPSNSSSMEASVNADSSL